ncbi:hypothetical protein D3C87_1279670 [compost metagenome]
MQLEAYVQTHHHQRGAEQERNPPAPRAELFIIQRHGQGQEQTVRRKKANRRPELWKHAEPGAFAFGGVLRGEQSCAAPFAAQSQALAETQHAEQDRRPGANAVVTRQHADQRGTHAHQQERGDQGRFAADAIAEVTEQCRPQGARKECDAECEKGRKHLGRAGRLRKEHRTDHQRCCGGVNVEVVELDGSADEARGGHAGGGVRRLRRCVVVSRAGCHAVIPDSHVPQWSELLWSRTQGCG